MKTYSVVFVGTGIFGVKTLEALAGNKRFEIPFVITGNDKKSGRGMVLTPSPVKKAVQETATLNKLFIQQPGRIRNLKQKLIHTAPDFILVVSYGEIIKKDILAIPRIGCINIHPSLLPKYRGASPVQETILSGDDRTGITWILMDERMDAGRVISQKPVAISGDENTIELAEKLSGAAASGTADALINFAGHGKSFLQDETQATYCKKIAKSDGLLDFKVETAVQMTRKIRAYTPWPGCYFVWNEKRIKIIQAVAVEQKISSGGPTVGEIRADKGKLLIGTLSGALDVITVQPESKKPMPAAEFIKGIKGTLGNLN